MVLIGLFSRLQSPSLTSQESRKMQVPIARHATQTNNKPIPKPEMEDGGNPCFSDKKQRLLNPLAWDGLDISHRQKSLA
jgi:hypothetical protein